MHFNSTKNAPSLTHRVTIFADTTSISRHREILTTGIVAFFVAMTISQLVSPAPNLHDDFGNLLIADTLLHGRFANPVPPAAESIESFHVITNPSYASKFPIGIGATLATGRLIFGTFNAGLWLSAALGSASIVWMLMACFNRKWAWTLGMLVALHPIWQNGWSQEYTHGWLAMAGMAIVLGGVLRLRKLDFTSDKVWRLLTRNGVMIATGAIMLMFSRPFEGALLTSIVSLPVAIKLLQSGSLRVQSFYWASVPALIIFSSGLAIQANINRSITGSAFRMPYQLHEAQYGVAPVFIWQKPHEPTLGHRYPEQIEFHRGWSMDAYKSANSPLGYSQLFSHRLQFIVQNWGTWFAIIPLTVLGLPRERRRFGYLFVAACVAIFAINCIPWIATTYVAPLIPLAIVLVCASLRGWLRVLSVFVHKNSTEGNQPSAPSQRIRLERLVMVLLIAVQCVGLVAATVGRVQAIQSQAPDWATQRLELVERLNRVNGNQLVLVRYELGHSVHREWVFNGADPAHSKIMWARWSEELNESVLSAYPNRKVWILDVAKNDATMLRSMHE